VTLPGESKPGYSREALQRMASAGADRGYLYETSISVVIQASGMHDAVPLARAAVESVKQTPGVRLARQAQAMPRWAGDERTQALRREIDRMRRIGGA
jgi:hypothetical protein